MYYTVYSTNGTKVLRSSPNYTIIMTIIPLTVVIGTSSSSRFFFTKLLPALSGLVG